MFKWVILKNRANLISREKKIVNFAFKTSFSD